MPVVVPFPQIEAILVDRRTVTALCRHHGMRQAELLLVDTVEGIRLDLAVMQDNYAAGQTGALAQRARQVSDAAALIGLTTLARAARDVAICSGSGDGVAFCAVWARLQRAGQRSMDRLWAYPGLQV